jgi:cell division protein FtsB
MIAKFRKKKKRSSWKSIFFSMFFVLLFIFVIGFLFITNWKIKQRRVELTNRIETLKQEVAILEGKNQEIKERISQSGKEEYLEEVARDQLGLKAPGEEVLVVKKEPAFAEVSEDEEEEKSWWEKFKSIWMRD